MGCGRNTEVNERKGRLISIQGSLTRNMVKYGGQWLRESEGVPGVNVEGTCREPVGVFRWKTEGILI